MGKRIGAKRLLAGLLCLVMAIRKEFKLAKADKKA